MILIITTSRRATEREFPNRSGLDNEHSLCAANVAACRAFDRLTPNAPKMLKRWTACGETIQEIYT